MRLHGQIFIEWGIKFPSDYFYPLLAFFSGQFINLGIFSGKDTDDTQGRGAKKFLRGIKVVIKVEE